MAKDHMRVNSILAKNFLALMSKCFMLKTTAKTTAEKRSVKRIALWDMLFNAVFSNKCCRAF